jgi:hypothetical protein
MVWLTWRQHRMQLVVTVALLAVCGMLLLAEKLPTDVVKMLPWSPVLIGLFWGVPLFVKEYERGTFQVTWTQTVTRRHWLLVKFGMLGAAVALAGLAVGGLVTTWSADEAYLNRMGDLFGASGVAAAGWFLLLFALGAAAGAFLRRMLPAMVVTIAVFAALVVAGFLGREHYAEPELAFGAVPAGAMVTDFGWMNAAGATVSADDLSDVCPGSDNPAGCVTAMGYDRGYTAYHSSSRYWRFQWTETAILVLGAVALAGVTARRTIRRAL